MKEKIFEKVLERLGDPGLVDKLVESLSFSELQSLLLEVFDRKRKKLRLVDILNQYRDDPYVRTSGVDPRRQMELDLLLASKLPDGCRFLELAPVAPLGCCSQVANFSQNRIVSTIRRNEVSSDPTNVLALEASLRRKSGEETVRLAASQRVLRSERVVSKDSFAHFRLFSLCVAGRDRGSYAFEMDAMTELIAFYDRALGALAESGYAFSDPRIIVKFKTDERMWTFKSRFDECGDRPSRIAIETKTDEGENWNYYSTLRFNLFVRRDSKEYFIADGGDTDWTAKILSNGKERYFISGFGSERFIAVCLPSADAPY